ncbi:MAG: hypothetical protein JWP88_1271 [Flaviaesturariibacter sp.]|nr:hypothetical protein [Flaviaesturariibacter sp.]
MRRLIFILLSFAFSQISFAQLPAFKPDTNNRDRSIAFLQKYLMCDHDFVLSFRYWSRPASPYYVLAHTGETWEALEIGYAYRPVTDTSTIKRFVVPSDSAIHLLNELTKVGFWTMNNDSLAFNPVKAGVNTFDRPTHRFEILRNTEYRIVQAYAPDVFYKRVPQSLPHERFLLCEALFLSFWKSKPYSSHF